MHYIGPVRNQSIASIDLMDDDSPLRVWISELDGKIVHYEKDDYDEEHVGDREQATLQWNVEQISGYYDSHVMNSILSHLTIFFLLKASSSDKFCGIVLWNYYFSKIRELNEAKENREEG